MELLDPNKFKKAKTLIYTLSIVIPVVVAVLFGVKIEGVDLSFLPPVYATINGITAIFIDLALVAIKKKNMKLHRAVYPFLLIAFIVVFSLLCCLSYDIRINACMVVTRTAYIYILISHILLSVAVVPLVSVYLSYLLGKEILSA